MSKSQHRACTFAAILTLLPLALGAAPTLPSASQIVALVKRTPQLKIDTTVSSSAYDAKTHPYVSVVGVPEGESVGGFLLADRAQGGSLAGGAQVFIVPLDSGGSGGIFTQIVFAQAGGHPFAYAGEIGSGGHLDVRAHGGSIVATMPYYGANDPNCCPSQRIVATYTVRNGHLVKLSEKRSAIPKRE